MKTHLHFRSFVITLIATVVIPLGGAAQDADAPSKKAQHHHYKLIDMVTFGGPGSYLEVDNGVNGAVNKVLNNRGTLVGWGDTPVFDPYAPNCINSDCYLTHAFQWRNGVFTDLGVLPNGDASMAVWVSDSGLIAGQSRNGEFDPLIPGQPEFHAVLWQYGELIDLGTLGGNESAAFSVNNRGQVVGVALNTVLDPYSFLVTQLRAFLWQDGTIQDLGTLGGPEAWALFINEHGQVAGFSLTNAAPNATTGYPTQDPFLWENGTMLDIGTLGGTFGQPYWLNERGQVAGSSNLAGDQIFHPFLWDRRKQPALIDLGTLGGDNGEALGMNDAGEAVGYADLPPNPVGCVGLGCVHHAFSWKNGAMTDLGTVDGDPCSRAFSINTKGQILGATAAVCGGELTHVFIWENSGPAVDLNELVIPGSDLALIPPAYINNRGEIAGMGLLPSGNEHAVLLIPCDDDHSDIEGCDYSLVDATLAPPARPVMRESSTHVPPSALWRRNNRVPFGLPIGPKN